jgi:hypothetical protein
MSNPPALRGLAAFLRRYREGTPDPSDETTIGNIARFRGCSQEDASERLGAIFQARSLVEGYIGREIGDEPSIRAVFSGLALDFGLSAAEANRMIPEHLTALLTHFQRWRRWGAEERQGILRQVAEIREQECQTPRDPISTPIFLKALDRFPAPEPIEAGKPTGTATEVVVPQPPVSHVVEPSSPPTPKEPCRPRDEGKFDRCVGIYMDAIFRNETPPSITEIARMAKCDKGTASRAIAPLEAKRAEVAREAARRQYGDVD